MASEEIAIGEDLPEQIQESNNPIENNTPEPYTYNSLLEQLNVIKKNNEKEMEDFDKTMKNIYHFQLEAVSTEIKQPQKFIADIQESHKKLEKMISTKNQEIYKLSHESYRTKQEINFLSKKNETYLNKIKNLEEEISLHTKSSTLQINHNLKLEQQLNELEEENKKLKEKLNPVQIVNGQGIAKPTLEQLILRMESTQHKLSHQLLILQGNLTSSKSKKESNSKDLNEVNGDIISKEKDIEKAKNKLNKLNKQIDFNEKRLVELQNQLQNQDLSDENNNTILKQISTIIEKNEDSKMRKLSIEEYIQIERSKLPEFKQMKNIQEEVFCLTKSKLEADLLLEKELKLKISKIQGVVDFLKCENNTLSGSLLSDITLRMDSVSITPSV